MKREKHEPLEMIGFFIFVFFAWFVAKELEGS